MRDGIKEILKEGGDGIGLWMVTLREKRGIFRDCRESKIKISNKLGVIKPEGQMIALENRSCFACGCMLQ